LWSNRGSVELYVYILCLVQFGSLVYNPIDYIPGERDRNAGERLEDYLRAIPGDVYIPNHPYLAVQAGKRPYAHSMALRDVLKGDENSIKRHLLDEIDGAFTDHRFSAIVLDRRKWWLEEDVTENYCPKDTTLFSENAFWPVSGARTRPERVFMRCSR